MADSPRKRKAEEASFDAPAEKRAKVDEAPIRRIGILTSGGDSQGMNAAVRGAVRAALNGGAEIFAIHEGYKGMVNGGGYITRITSMDVTGTLHLGGTIIGTARCMEFMTREGRLRGARNLMYHGIDALIVIGGDGSLTGANTLMKEWPGLLDELVAKGELSPDVSARHGHLQLVGLVGSIDNDMVGTDYTIGAASALQRIVEAVDAIASTADSHQRTFVVEVMGRNCGWLALTAAAATGADWVFIPEQPPNTDDWAAAMCERLADFRSHGKRCSIVILAEGAKDRTGAPITSHAVKEALERRLGHDTRITVLGHVQRGGTPAAFDRYMASMMGLRATERILMTPCGTQAEPVMVGLHHNDFVYRPLMEMVDKTCSVASLVKERRFDEAMAMRGESFSIFWETYKALVKPHPKPGDGTGKTVAIMHIGAPAPGMNAAVRAAARMLAHDGHTVLGVRNGMEGLLKGLVTPLTWEQVDKWAIAGGATLGTSRATLTKGGNAAGVAAALEKHNVAGLIFVGGFEAYTAVSEMQKVAPIYPALRVPVCVLPATISNNCPSTSYSIGCDTAINAIVESCDRIKQSAVSAYRRAFIIEVMGARCGYLAVVGAIAGGAERAYIPEEGDLTLAAIQEDIAALQKRFARDALTAPYGLLLRTNQADEHYTTEMLAKIFEGEGRGNFSVRTAVPGHLQQGGAPSPLDRIHGMSFGRAAAEWMQAELKAGTAGVGAVGLSNGRVGVTPFAEVMDEMDSVNRRPKSQWWLGLVRAIATLTRVNMDDSARVIP